MADMIRYKNRSMVFAHPFRCVRCEKTALLPETPAHCPGCGKLVETVDYAEGPPTAHVLHMPVLSVGSVLLN